MTPRFRKKPVEVDAVQWTEDSPPTLTDGWRPYKCMPIDAPVAGWHVFVAKHGGWVPIARKDWIIAELDGAGWYPCKPDIFDATFEAVAPASAEASEAAPE